MTSSAPVVAAVVPALHPGGGLVALVGELSAQTGGRVVVVDDSGDPAPGEVLAHCAALGAVVVRHDANAGIGAALATGLARVRERWPDAGLVLTVDQDSRLAPDHVTRQLAALDAARQAGLRVGLVGPQDVEGMPTRAGGTRRGVLLGREPVQSGLLVPLAVLDDVGGPDPGLVIDGVDSDLWLRALDGGYETVVAPGLHVGHRLGTATPLTLLGRPVTRHGRPLEVPVSAPFRSYYLVRNRLRLAARHGRRHPGWAAGQLLGLARHLVLVLLLEPAGRRERLRAVGAGLRDAVRRRDGLRP